MEKCPRCAAESLTDPEHGLPWCAQCGAFSHLAPPACRGLWWWRDAATRAPLQPRKH